MVGTIMHTPWWEYVIYKPVGVAGGCAHAAFTVQQDADLNESENCVSIKSIVETYFMKETHF